MSYAEFQQMVQRIADKLGLSVECAHEDGRHKAEFSDGTRFTANAIAQRVSVRWGSGHTSTATVEQLRAI